MAPFDSHGLGGNDGFSSPLSSPPSSLPSTPSSVKDILPESEDIATPVMGKRKRGANTTKKPAKKTKKPDPYYINKQGGKLPPCGQPLVWSEKRQGLCEALPYYNAYQSGAYTNGKIVKGFLCDGEVGDRDYFGDQIMIARVGGGKTVDEATGTRVQTKSQDDCPLATAFQNTQQILQPVVVIAGKLIPVTSYPVYLLMCTPGQGNTGSPSKLPHYYNVLDHFHVTDIWAEKYNLITRWMVRLEKINLDQQSWWTAEGTSHSPPNFVSPKAPVRQCPTCKAFSKTIYQQGWVCLNADPVPVTGPQGEHEKTTCPDFFNFGADVDDKTLKFTGQFLQERTPFKGHVTEPLIPPFLTEAAADSIGALAFEEKCRKGIVCSQCGCCSSRVNWAKWVCENPICDFEYSLTPRVIPASLAISDSKPPKPQDAFVYKSIRFTTSNRGSWKVTKYRLPDEESGCAGYISHFTSNTAINQRPGGPDDLFIELQTADLNLKRKPSRTATKKNEVLTAHWAHNWGAPYKYSVAQESTAFGDAPPVILKVLKRLTWAGKEAVMGGHDTVEGDEEFQSFNELLSVGYFENSHMGYHDDGEKTLGSTVASISLGCSSTMKWRPKRLNKIVSEQENKNQRGTKKEVLSIVLKHGDIVVQHGSGIQKLYEHTVIPNGKLRFALTSRYIVPETLKKEDLEYAKKAGELPVWSSEYEYDGDLGVITPMHTLPSPSSLPSLPSLPRCLQTPNPHEKVSTDGTFASEQVRDSYFSGLESMRAVSSAQATGMMPCAISSPESQQQQFNYENYELAPAFAAQAVGTMHTSYEQYKHLEHQPASPSAAQNAGRSLQKSLQQQYSSSPSMTQTVGSFTPGSEYREYNFEYEPAITQAPTIVQPQSQHDQTYYGYDYNYTT
ncbi:hypothetical protein N431DRAFT_420140 [Stipitochalara longipes BDJ]|nr:hypothetical protein N431DRAFT_420140 [Stipitochalara longipes BDJ]